MKTRCENEGEGVVFTNHAIFPHCWSSNMRSVVVVFCYSLLAVPSIASI